MQYLFTTRCNVLHACRMGRDLGVWLSYTLHFRLLLQQGLVIIISVEWCLFYLLFNDTIKSARSANGSKGREEEEIDIN